MAGRPFDRVATFARVVAPLALLICSIAQLAAAQSAPASAAATAPAKPEYSYWSSGDPRLFLSTRSELGALYAKPYLSAGYGLPHWIWGGVDLTALATPDLAQFFTGLRAATPILEASFGFRDTWSYVKPFLAPARTFSRSDVLDAPGPSARYLAWEGEIDAIAPLPYSAIIVNLIYVRTIDVPRDRYLYEEDYRVIVADRTFYSLRFAACARILPEEALKVGVASDFVFGTGREHGVVRLGPVGLLQLTDHLQIEAGVLFTVYSPDQLGLILGTYAVAGFRYQWATGERKPELPWHGRIIP